MIWDCHWLTISCRPIWLPALFSCRYHQFLKATTITSVAVDNNTNNIRLRLNQNAMKLHICSIRGWWYNSLYREEKSSLQLQLNLINYFQRYHKLYSVSIGLGWPCQRRAISVFCQKIHVCRFRMRTRLQWYPYRHKHTQRQHTHTHTVTELRRAKAQNLSFGEVHLLLLIFMCIMCTTTTTWPKTCYALCTQHTHSPIA